jgi:hypothetical protein
MCCPCLFFLLFNYGVLQTLLISNLSTSVKGGDVGIVEFIRERVADVLRACRGRVALSGNINVSDVSREFLAMSNFVSLGIHLRPELSS